LNVSRSYLQSDQNVKKISGYITRKVADRLQELFDADRKGYEAKWDDLKIFIEYGMLSDEKFYDKATGFALVKNTDNFYYTLEEYRKLTEGNQKDKDGQLIYLYANKREEQFSYIEAAKAKGYDVLMMDGQLDTPFMNQQEQKQEKCHFSRVDADTINNLIRKENAAEVTLTDDEKRAWGGLFQSQVPKVEKAEFQVTFEAMDETDKPVTVTQNEWMRRMKEMSAMQPGMSFYGEMPDSYNLVVNTSHPAVKKVLDAAKAALGDNLTPIATQISEKEGQIKPLEEEKYKAKAGEFPKEKDELLDSLRHEVEDLKKSETTQVSEYGKSDATLRQLVDLALLEGGMLKGEALAAFIKRSTELLGK
jgi:molecular chaperone HtpG